MMYAGTLITKMMQSCRLALLLALLTTLLAAATRSEATDNASILNKKNSTEEREVKAMRLEVMHRDNPDSPLRMAEMDDTNYVAIWLQRDKIRIAGMKRESAKSRFVEGGGGRPWKGVAAPIKGSPEHNLSMAADSIEMSQPRPLGWVDQWRRDAPIDVRASILTDSRGGYLVEILLGGSDGGPARPQSVLLDTGSELTWVQCQPCQHCVPQRDPIYKPLKSGTFAKVSCNNWQCSLLEERFCDTKTNTCMYKLEYYDGSETTGMLGLETLGLMNLEVDQVLIGCSQNTHGVFSGEAGILGLGRGPVSVLTSQGNSLGSALFAYCLPQPFNKARGYLQIGGVIDTNIPLFMHPRLKRHYYIPLIGLGVNNQRLPIDPNTFQIDPSQQKETGVMLDTGTSVSHFPSPIYNLLRDEVRKVLKIGGYDAFHSGYELDTCYKFPSANITSVSGLPTVQLYFEGNVTLSLDPINVFHHMPDILGPTIDQAQCLTMTSTADGELFSIIGNIQMQGIEWSFNLDREEIGFQRNAC